MGNSKEVNSGERLRGEERGEIAYHGGRGEIALHGEKGGQLETGIARIKNTNGTPLGTLFFMAFLYTFLHRYCSR